MAPPARQATPSVTDEVDGLLVNGIHPMGFKVAPALLAMFLMSCRFVVWVSKETIAKARKGLGQV